MFKHIHYYTFDESLNHKIKNMANQSNWVLDPTHSKIQFKVKH